MECTRPATPVKSSTAPAEITMIKILVIEDPKIAYTPSQLGMIPICDAAANPIISRRPASSIEARPAAIPTAADSARLTKMELKSHRFETIFVLQITKILASSTGTLIAKTIDVRNR